MGDDVPVFPSEAWFRAVIEIAEADPQAAEAGVGWSGDLAFVVEESGEGPGFAVWGRPEGGKIAEWRVLESVAEVDELRPAYVARASLRTWRDLLSGDLDPVEAVLFRKLRVVGSVEQLMDRLRFKGLAKRVLESIETTFA